MDQPAVQLMLATLKTPPFVMFEECVVEGKTAEDLVRHGKLDLVIGEVEDLDTDTDTSYVAVVVADRPVIVERPGAVSVKRDINLESRKSGK